MNRNCRINNYWDLFYELVRTDFVLRYHNSVLGFVWVFLKPFLLFLTLMVVFSWFFNSQVPYYNLNLLLGIIIYSYFQEAVMRGVSCLYEKSSIILKVNFPKKLAVMTSVVNSFISFFFSFLVFLVFWLWAKPAGSLFYLPYFFLQISILTILILGINFVVSIIYIKLRDLMSISEIGLRLIFYLTPIIYPLTIIPERLRPILLLNPLAVVITQSQNTLVSGLQASWQVTVYAFILAGLVALFGWYWFRKNINAVAENF